MCPVDFSIQSSILLQVVKIPNVVISEFFYSLFLRNSLHIFLYFADEINFFAISGKFSDFDLSRKSSNKKYESQKDIKYESGNGMKNEKETRFVVKRSNSFAAGEVLYNFDAELNEVKRFAFIEESLRVNIPIFVIVIIILFHK